MHGGVLFMAIINFIKKNKILSFSLFGYLVLLIFRSDLILHALSKSSYYFSEMLQILPAVFVLTALIQTWVPTKTIVKHFGSSSGLKGKFISLAIGSLSAGPIYAAFPVCQMLLNKGATISNIIIILSSWAVVKVPMLLNEVKFMGFKYMIVRWFLTIITIFIMAYIIDRVTKKTDLPKNNQQNDHLLLIQEEVCVGCGICTKICPEIFRIESKKAKIISTSNLADHDLQIKEAIEACPVMAISLKDFTIHKRARN